MTKLLIFLVLTAIVVGYITFGRDLVKAQPWFVRWVEPVEIALWRKSETLLKARFLMATGAVLSFLTQIGSLNLSPLLLFLPEEYRDTANAVLAIVPLLISAIGALDEYQRRNTSQPLPVVEIPTNAAPELKAVVATVEATNAQAVAVVAEAKAEGSI